MTDKESKKSPVSQRLKSFKDKEMNYATKQVRLLIVNNEQLYIFFKEIRETLRASAFEARQVTEKIWSQEEYITFSLSDVTKNYFEERMDLDIPAY